MVLKFSIWRCSAVLCLLWCLTFFQLSNSLGQPQCDHIFYHKQSFLSDDDLSQSAGPLSNRSQLIVGAGITHFMHQTVGKSLLEILRLSEISSFDRAKNSHHTDPVKFNGASDVVYLMGVEYSSKRFDPPTSQDKIYFSTEQNILNSRVGIFLKPSVIEDKNFAWVSRGWPYGQFLKEGSYLAKDLSVFLSNKQNWNLRNEFLFRDKIKISIEDIDFIVAANTGQRYFLITYLQSKYGHLKLWEDFVRTPDKRTYTNDPLQLDDHEFYTVEGGTEAFHALKKINRDRALRIARVAEKYLDQPLFYDVMSFLVIEDISEFIRIFQNLNPKQAQLCLEDILNRLDQSVILNSKQFQSFLIQHMDQSKNVRDHIKDTKLVQAYLDQNYLKLIQNEAVFIRDFSTMVWGDFIKSSLKQRLQDLNDEALLKIGLYSFGHGADESLNILWVRKSIIHILRERGRDDYVAMLLEMQ